MIQGLHHVSLSAAGTENFEQAVVFYRNLLGLTEIRSWGVRPAGGIMLDGGNCIIEIMANGNENENKGPWGHIAFKVEDTDSICEKIRRAGFEIKMEPCNKNLNGYPIRICFCYGPCGEEIEFLQEL